MYPRKRKAGPNYKPHQVFEWDDLKHRGMLLSHWKAMIGERVGDGEPKKEEFDIVLGKLMDPNSPLVYEEIFQVKVKDSVNKEWKLDERKRYRLNVHGKAFLNHKHNLKETDPEWTLYDLLDNFNMPKR